VQGVGIHREQFGSVDGFHSIFPLCLWPPNDGRA
jgi:hypothetical protein